jgi:hypothetical protein
MTNGAVQVGLTQAEAQVAQVKIQEQELMLLAALVL